MLRASQWISGSGVFHCGCLWRCLWCILWSLSSAINVLGNGSIFNTIVMIIFGDTPVNLIIRTLKWHCHHWGCCCSNCLRCYRLHCGVCLKGIREIKTPIIIFFIADYSADYNFSFTWTWPNVSFCQIFSLIQRKNIKYSHFRTWTTI